MHVGALPASVPFPPDDPLPASVPSFVELPLPLFESPPLSFEEEEPPPPFCAPPFEDPDPEPLPCLGAPASFFPPVDVLVFRHVTGASVGVAHA
jgi:hypothetical protein